VLTLSGDVDANSKHHQLSSVHGWRCRHDLQISSARRKRVQQPSHSLATPSAILISVRSRSVPEHRPQDANEQQCCDWPMKPDSVRIGENID
jgi:hypothetical protein